MSWADWILVSKMAQDMSQVVSDLLNQRDVNFKNASNNEVHKLQDLVVAVAQKYSLQVDLALPHTDDDKPEPRPLMPTVEKSSSAPEETEKIQDVPVVSREEVNVSRETLQNNDKNIVSVQSASPEKKIESKPHVENTEKPQSQVQSQVIQSKPQVEIEENSQNHSPATNTPRLPLLQTWEIEIVSEDQPRTVIHTMNQTIEVYGVYSPQLGTIDPDTLPDWKDRARMVIDSAHADIERFNPKYRARGNRPENKLLIILKSYHQPVVHENAPVVDSQMGKPYEQASTEMVELPSLEDAQAYPFSSINSVLKGEVGHSVTEIDFRFMARLNVDLNAQRLLNRQSVVTCSVSNERIYNAPLRIQSQHELTPEAIADEVFRRLLRNDSSLSFVDNFQNRIVPVGIQFFSINANENGVYDYHFVTNMVVS